MRRERACKGCDGAGCQHDWERRCLEGDKSCQVCPACRGTGRVVDSIPAADAVADAESFEHVSAVYLQEVNGGRPYGDGAEWLETYTLGIAARVYAQDHNPFWAKIRASQAARAAFRAVPGLRG